MGFDVDDPRLIVFVLLRQTRRHGIRKDDAFIVSPEEGADFCRTDRKGGLQRIGFDRLGRQVDTAKTLGVTGLRNEGDTLAVR